VDNHRDHRAIAMLSLDAWIRLNRRFPLYFYEVSDGEDTTMFSPTDYVDIEAAEPRKRAACYAHASQSPDKYFELQDQVCPLPRHRKPPDKEAFPPARRQSDIHAPK
jgi:LmbE family N-acetylglucosaminyl deacetylase